MKRCLTVASLAALAAGGCATKPPDPALFVQPTVAVMKFENRAAFPLRWKLGDGMADILVDRLMATRRFHVIERPELGSVLGELRLQHSGATRRQRKAAPGRLKNVQYLIKGTVTDFGHVSTTSGWLKARSWGFSGSHARAIVGMTFSVVDVESGEILSSQRLEGSVNAESVAVKGRYQDVAMGGSVFYQTPLGRATARVMDDAVRKITEAIASRRWQPKIAVLNDDGTVLLNGGADRKVAVGGQYDVLETGQAIADPDTGDMVSDLFFWRFVTPLFTVAYITFS